MKMLLQVILIIILAPLMSGLIKKIKNNARMRKGAPILQPYYNLAKLIKKDETISKDTSYIFKVTPYIVLTASIAAAFLTPFFFPGDVHLSSCGTGASYRALCGVFKRRGKRNRLSYGIRSCL